MSQIYIPVSDSVIPVDVPTSFVTDNGTAVPAVHILNVNGGFTDSNNTNGIATVANPVPTVGTNNLIIQLTNRFSSSATILSDPIPAPIVIVSFNLGGSTAAYRFKFDVIARVTATTQPLINIGDTMGYTLFSTFKTIASVASIIETPFIDADEEINVQSALLTMIAAGNFAALQFTPPPNTSVIYQVTGEYVVI